MRERDLKERTKQLGLEILRFAGKLPKGMEYQMIRRQLTRAAASVGANYRAACRSRSKKDFIARLGVVTRTSLSRARRTSVTTRGGRRVPPAACSS